MTAKENPKQTTPPDGSRRDLIERAKAALPEDATDKDIAAQANFMARMERGVTWMELVESGWTFGADEVRQILGD